MPKYRVDRLTTTDELGPTEPCGTIEAETPSAAVSMIVLRSKTKEAPTPRGVFVVTTLAPEGATPKQIAANDRIPPKIVRFGWGRR